MAGNRNGPRDGLLTAAIDYVATHGVSDLSLRGLAEAIGTSHRMLIYHFGSKEGLLVAVVQAVERQQRDAFAQLERDLGPAATFTDLTRRTWRRLSDPTQSPHERLFFELYGRALCGDPALAPFLDGIVSAWAEPAIALLGRLGLPEPEAAAQARLGIAVMRGLLLDLLATGDRAAVDQALEHFIAISGTPPTGSFRH